MPSKVGRGGSPKWWQIIIGPGNLATIFFICLIRLMKACQVNQFTGIFPHVLNYLANVLGGKALKKHFRSI